MKIEDLKLDRLIPPYISEDKDFQGIIYALEKEIKRISELNNLIMLYLNIDMLEEHILDELAWQFNIPEYDKGFDIDIKRSLIKDCMSIHHRRGTVSAVKEVAEKIFGNATIQEWFEYGGEPYHFKVSTTNISADDAMIESFRKIVTETQNVRSHLEEVLIDVMNSLQFNVGCKFFQFETIEFKTLDVD